jgi:hypothetical protein
MHGDIVGALHHGDGSIGPLKRLTRLGMGRCQGRYCAPLAVSLLSRRCGKNSDEYDFPAPRPPVKPVPIGVLAIGAE